MMKRNVRLQIKRQFEADGVAITEWAKERGYKPRLVYAVLSGQVKCKRGKGHKIAVELGLKKRPVANAA